MATAMKKRGFSKKRVRSRRLKGKGQLIAKSKWKEIDIKPEDAHFDDTGGLVLFEELDDYELLTKRDYSEEQQDDSSDEVEFEEEKSKKKGKKRKQHDEESDSKPPKKKKKKKKKVQTQTKQDHEKRKIEETVGTKRRGKQLEVIAADSEDSDVEKDEEDENEEWKNLDMSAWLNLYVPEPILHGLADKGFTTPTPIQTRCLPPAIRDYQDIIGAAETGSGKTLAFGIPILHHILEIQEKEERQKEKKLKKCGTFDDSSESTTHDSLLALILTPTRELAIQVRNHLVAVSKHTDIKIAVIVGGMSAQKQERVLKKRPQIVIGTPGRLWELIQQHEPHLRTVNRVKYLVLDEADRMVEKGHFEELSLLLDLINGTEMKRQMFVFSATLTMVHLGPQRKLMKKKYDLNKEQKLESLIFQIGIRENHMKVVDLTKKELTVETLTEARINCTLEEKDYYLFYFLLQYPGRTLVFTNSIDCIRRLVSIFTLLGKRPLPLHANMHQKQRLKNLERFSSDAKGLLLATDVAARGLDIPNVQHVVHYQIPRTAEVYVHRSGRTARASKAGLSLALIGADDMANYKRLCKTLSKDEDIPVFPIEMRYLTAVKERVNAARTLDKMDHQFMKKKHHNDWFSKTAKELDIDLDEDLCLHDMGDNFEQKQHERKVKKMKMDLKAMLQRPVFPKGFSALFPTVGGHLNIPKTYNAAAGTTMNAIDAVKQEKKDMAALIQNVKLPRKQKQKQKKRKRVK